LEIGCAVQLDPELPTQDEETILRVLGEFGTMGGIAYWQ
jgi:hypothetical protein